MDSEELKEKIRKHGLWLQGLDGGERADLRGAVLRGAVLRGADLRDADLRGAVLRDAVGAVIGPQRSDGYRFDATLTDDGWMVRAGCQFRTLEDYRKHTEDYGDPMKQAETLAILDYLEARIKQVTK
jgi:uncharacterized protein YjbI with pentapeptide repeats